MNKILELKGAFNTAPGTGGGGLQIPAGTVIMASDIIRIRDSLRQVHAFWLQDTVGIMPLVSIHYNRVVAKSNRMTRLLVKRGTPVNDTVVGARFAEGVSPKHIITYCLPLETIVQAMAYLDILLSLMQRFFSDGMDAQMFHSLGNPKVPFPCDEKAFMQALADAHLSMNACKELLKDICYIERCIVNVDIPHIETSQIVTLYDTGLKFPQLLTKLGLDSDGQFIDHLDDVTWLVTPAQFAKIVGVAPYLVSMSVTNIGDIDPVQRHALPGVGMYIPQPTNEPVIGLIDTLFDASVYFSSWVDSTNMLTSDIPWSDDDMFHGTAVASLLVDGPALNPYLEDGCGRFRVKHFAVARHGKTSTVDIMRKIRSIVAANRDIKVWNVSLGSPLAIDPNFISPEGALLDELQSEFDVLFVVAGTNNTDRTRIHPPIGAPADSLNSVVVNSVSFDDTPAPYSRNGLVLGFYNKPDVCAYGGDELDSIVVYSTQGRAKVQGTSFAAPWVARKLAYLIHIMRFPREVAKALILDAAIEWRTFDSHQNLVGFGRVPTHINEILQSADNEIKFVLYGHTMGYDTYAYTIPVPMHNDAYPYIAKATLCYFPSCSRKQGVDYTNSELDLHFGRMNKNGSIKAINKNEQGTPQVITLYEVDARKNFRKWDNVKHISEAIKDKARPRKRENLNNNSWGISIMRKQRLNSHDNKKIGFGVVVTLREMYGVNRYAQFMQQCRANNWFVTQVDVDTMVDTYALAENEIVFE